MTSKVSPDPVTLHGGCDCSSIKYTISVPSLPDRQIASVSFPKIFFDHCNKCRRVSGAIVQAWLVVPQSWISWTLTPPLSSNSKSSTSPTISTQSLILLQPHESTVINYTSSPGITRSFCGKCGTNLSFVSESRDEIKTVDIVLGSLETESLEVEGVRPDRHFYWESGVRWVKEWAREGDGCLGDGGEGFPRHPEGTRRDVCRE